MFGALFSLVPSLTKDTLIFLSVPNDTAHEIDWPVYHCIAPAATENSPSDRRRRDRRGKRKRRMASMQLHDLMVSTSSRALVHGRVTCISLCCRTAPQPQPSTPDPRLHHTRAVHPHRLSGSRLLIREGAKRLYSLCVPVALNQKS